MATAKTKEEITDAPETLKRTRSPRINTDVTPKGEAKVTIQYNAQVNENEKETNSNNNKTGNQAPFHFPLNRQMETPQIPRNSLAYITDVLNADGEENYLAIVTRRKDYPTDKFNSACFSDRQYPEPIPITPKEVLMFLTSYLLKLNDNSGGRFDIFFCNAETAEMVEDAYLRNFEVHNPPKIENATASGNNDLQVLQMFEQMQARSDERFAELLKTIAKPQEKDRFSELAETVLMKKLTDDTPPANAYNPTDVIKSIFESRAVVETLSEQMANAFGGQKEDKPAYLLLMDSEAGKVIAEKGLGVLERIGGLLAMSMQARNANIQPQINVTSNPQTQPEQPPQQQLTPEQIDIINQQTEINMQDLIDEIIEVLEKNEPLTGDNEDLMSMIEHYPAVFPMIETACKMQDFDTVLITLTSLVPETFAEYKNEKGEFNEKGEHLKTRLKEFYDFVRQG